MDRRLLLAAAIVTTAALFPVIGKPAVSTQSSVVELRPVWNRVMEAPITDIRLSSSGRCVAVSTKDNIVVMDPAGGELWRWDFRKDNRFVAAEKVAVSPNCDWVALAGNPSYRYAWIVHQKGRRISIKTEATPLAVDIDHSGTSVVIGTGAAFVLRYTSEGILQWKLDVGGYLPIEEISFFDDDGAIMVSSWEQAIVSAEGKRLPFTGVWGFGSMRAARDFKTFVAWGQPPHGAGIGRVRLLDNAGQEIWIRVATDPRAIISPAGDLVIVQTNDRQDVSESDTYSPQLENLPRALRLLSRAGDIIRTYSAHGSPVAFSPDGRSFVLHQDDGFLALDIDENKLWKIPRSGNPLLASTSDLRSIVLAQENRLEWYSPPPQRGGSDR